MSIHTLKPTATQRILNNDKQTHKKETVKLWSSIGLSSNLLSRGREAHQSSRSRKVWGRGRSRKAAGPAGEDGWTPYPPHGTGKWWEPHASSWRTSPAGEQPEAFHKFSGGVQFDDNYDFFLSNTSRNMLHVYISFFWITAFFKL